MASVRVIGAHPKDGTDIQVRKGRFGPYVQHGQTVANLPKNVTMEEIGLAQAVTLLAEKGKQLKPKGKNGKAAPAKKAAPEKKAAAGAITAAAPAKSTKRTQVKTATAKTLATKPAKKPATRKAAPRPS
jgi:DNA topoisomerase-1